MNIVTLEFQRTIEELIEKVSAENCSPEELELSQKYNALPFGYDLWSVVLLTSKGEIIDQDFDGEIQHHEFNLQFLIRLLFVEKERFPELEKFIPDRSDETKDCPVCQGTKRMNSEFDSISCLVCVGMGWVTAEFWKAFTENQKKLKA